MTRLLLLITALLLLPLSAQAWWNPDWKFRKKLTLDTAQVQAPAGETASNVPVAVRLHSGNFLFTDAKPDGSDLRFVSGDDKTPLKHHVELFDAANQLAIIWVQVPQVTQAAAGAAGVSMWMYSGNPQVAAADDAKGVFAPAQRLRLDFGQAGGAFKDTSPYAHTVAANGVATGPAGLAGWSAVFSGQPLRVTLGDGARFATPGFTWSAWVKPTSGARSRLLSFGPVTLDLADGRLSAALERSTVQGEGVVAGTWHHVALSVGERLTLHVDGKPVGTQPVSWRDPGTALVLGDGFNGEMDVMELSAGVASALALQLQAAQGVDSTLLVYGEPEQGAGESDAHGGYVTVLMNSLTLDAKIVIVILAFMFAVAVYVMVDKSLMVARVDNSNEKFLKEFETRPGLYLDPRTEETKAMRNGGAPRHSSLARLYGTGMRELERRAKGGQQTSLSAEAVAAIKASIDSTLIRETQKLNRLMVLLTIAISGGPFLGLLGTVVGVMITFAAIAASGDININSIAPGIAAALLATVAGLGVAIPALFGYNYLITRIKNINADMQAFSDEFITRMAEAHNQ